MTHSYVDTHFIGFSYILHSFHTAIEPIPASIEQILVQRPVRIRALWRGQTRKCNGKYNHARRYCPTETLFTYNQLPTGRPN